MSSLGEWLNAMVALREQKAKVQEFNYQAQQQGFSSLMGGLEGLGKGLIGSMGSGQTKDDLLTNRLYNQANPPRAQAVNQGLQAGADQTVLPGQVPYSTQPLTAGGPFTGGVKGLAVQGVLDKSDIAQQKLADQQQLNEARIGNYGSLAEARGSAADVARQRLEETIAHHGEIMDARAQAEKDKMALAAMGQATEKYQGDVKNAHAHNTGMTAALAKAAGAKTQEDWQKAVTVITGLYQAGTKQGFKDLPYPEIPMSPDQKKAAATAVTDAGDQTAFSLNPFNLHLLSPYQSDIDAAKKAALAAPGAPGGYQYGGPADYELAPEPTAPSTRPQDYYPGGPGSPVAAPQGQPSQAGGAAPEGITIIKNGVKMRKVNGKWVVVQ